ncbi:hypothetical protein AAHB49_16260 [Bacillus cereus]
MKHQPKKKGYLQMKRIPNTFVGHEYIKGVIREQIIKDFILNRDQ